MAGIAGNVIDTLVHSDVVAPEDKDIHIFGLQQGLFMLLNIATTIMIGLVFGMFMQSLVFMLSYLPLRSVAGGYHAKTQLKCYLFSTVIVSATLLGIKYIPWTSFICLILLTFVGGIIFFSCTSGGQQ